MISKHRFILFVAKRFSKEEEEKKEQNTIFQIHRNPKFAKRVEHCQHRESQ